MGEERDRFKYETEHLNMASIAPDNGKHSIGNAPWWFKMQLVILTISVIGIITAFAGVLVPFEPYHFYGWKDIPSEVCPGDEILPTTVTKVDAGPYTIGDIIGYAGIVNSNEVPVDTWDIEVDVDPYPKQSMPSRVIRTAPDNRGYYKLTFNSELHGKMFGIVPRYQEVKRTSNKSFFVRSEYDSRCEKK